jgi:LmbE family N-acetylglucosaminyl deacetylase
MSLCVFAFGCHPDDIEILMSGTLFLLRETGARIHYMNPANGCLGSNEYSREETIRVRRQESIDAAAMLGAEFHESIANDFEVFYNPELLAKATAVVRDVRPDILLLLSTEDYMEDHMNASRLGYGAAFCRGMKNFTTDPVRPPYMDDVAVYHAMPYSLGTMLNEPVWPHFCVNVDSVTDRKRSMLAAHRSQKSWLDESQGLDSYITSMMDHAAAVGRISEVFQYAEGWRRHNHLGFCREGYRPLEEVLQKHVIEMEPREISRN